MVAFAGSADSIAESGSIGASPSPLVVQTQRKNRIALNCLLHGCSLLLHRPPYNNTASAVLYIILSITPAPLRLLRISVLLIASFRCPTSLPYTL